MEKQQSHQSVVNTLSHLIIDSPSECVSENPAHQDVGEGLRRADLKDDERERHIASCGYLMLAAYKRYEASNCFSDRGEADRWRVLMQEGIKSRNAAQVRKLEIKRGLV